MIVATLLMASAPGRAQALFDACAASHRHLTSYAVHVDTVTTVSGKRETRQFDFAVVGGKALFRMREPASGLLDRSDRSILMLAGKLVAYDAVANETLTRPNTEGGNYSARLTGVLGPLPEELTLVLDPSALSQFLAKFKGFRDWDLIRSGSEAMLLRRANGAETSFRFTGTKHLLSDVSIRLKNSKLHWSYSFRAVSNVALRVPADANRVTAFAVRAAPPKYASKQAQNIVESMEKAYAGLKRGRIDVTSLEGPEKLWLGDKKLREDRTGFQWAYDGTTLSILNRRTHRFYRGKALRVTLSEFIVAVGAEVDPIIMRIIAHRTPYGNLFPSASIVKVKGTVSSDSGASDIIQVSGGSPRSSMFVRQKDHLLESMESETVDAKGRVQTKSNRQFKYSELGTTPPSHIFQLNPDGMKILPLPFIKGISKREVEPSP